MDNDYQKLIDEAFYFNYLMDINKAVNTFAIVMITDRHGTIIDVNQKMADISG